MVAMSDFTSLPARLPSAAPRLLIPVKRPGDARQAISYAISRCTDGGSVEVALLHVESVAARWPVGDGERSVQAVAQQASAALFARASQMLERCQIEFAVYVRSGPVVFSILDAAEELDCSEIVVPAPARPLARLWSQRVVDALLAGQRSIPVVTVDKRGRRLTLVATAAPA